MVRHKGIQYLENVSRKMTAMDLSDYFCLRKVSTICQLQTINMHF